MFAHFPRMISLLPLTFSICAFTQVSAPPPDQDLQKTEIDLTHAVPLPGLPATGVIAYPFSCSSDGDLYAGELVMNEDGRPVSTIPDLYKISPQASVKRIPKPVPTSAYKQLDSPSFFAGGSTLVTLIRASRPTDQDGQVHPGTDFFLSVTDSDGNHPKLIRLDLDFSAVKAAVFGSGEFLILGLDRKTSEPIVALLGPEGQFRKYLDGPKAEDTRDEADNADTRKRNLSFSVSAAQFAPWGTDILLTAPGIDTSSVYHFRAAGQVERVHIMLPSDQQLAGVLGSGGKDTWVIRAQSSESAKKMATVHVVENPEEFLFEVNPLNGQVLRRLDVRGPHPGEIACAADGKLAAIYPGDTQAGAPDQLVFASTRR